MISRNLEQSDFGEVPSGKTGKEKEDGRGQTNPGERLESSGVVPLEGPGSGGLWGKSYLP